jgi:hypothetical protein
MSVVSSIGFLAFIFLFRLLMFGPSLDNARIWSEVAKGPGSNKHRRASGYRVEQKL